MSHKKKVAVGLSGGVDSAVSALLLKEKGYEVTGVYIECWNEPGCRATQDRKDALQTALHLGIGFTELDYRRQYNNEVLQYFFDEYKKGRTPNPDVVCNKIIKFGLFYKWAIEQGFDFVATGHYAKIIEIDGKPELTVANDQHKDQTYFLYQLKAQQLSKILFPIGELKKPQVREIALKNQLAIANKKDSVGICFVGEIDVHEFLKQRLGENPGDVVDEQGNIVGHHQGLWFYTIGQRQGFMIDNKALLKSHGNLLSNHKIPALYVIAKDFAKNQLVVGPHTQALSNRFKITNPHFIYHENSEKIDQQKMLVRIRHGGDLLPCKLTKNDVLLVELEQQAFGIAPGQSAVIYQSKDQHITCLGGGIIS
ncbi:MAG: tRNA 2-thiouridine(34) synthase MnmA [Patescibacteria group bacterium]